MANLFDGTPTVAASGSTIKVKYCNPNRAGDTVELTFDDGNDNQEVRSVTLDANGCVEFDYTVPNWITVQINGPDSEQHSIAVSTS